MEGVAWKCTESLWDAHQLSVALIHENSCPPKCEATFTGKEAISSSTPLIIIRKRRYAFRKALLKRLLFSAVVSTQFTSIPGQGVILVVALGIWTYKEFWGSCAPYSPFSQAVHIVMILRCPSWLQDQTWTKVSNFCYFGILFLCQLLYIRQSNVICIYIASLLMTNMSFSSA